MNRLRSNPLPVVQLREALSSGLGALPDAELLDRFARYADHVAFEVLLRRHGPMVFGVCRRTLSSAADADDAFQATFLVFLRKAKQIRGERLGPWLYGVAWRVAQKARVRAARLAAYRTEGIEMLPAADDNAPVPDWLPVLDAELSALPTKYREALVLCELQGRSRAEAARELGLREGTLSSRLARGRDLLRKRLLKHGTLLPAGGLAALFGASEVGRATAPGALLAKVSELAKGAGAGAVPVGAVRLTDEVLRSMLLMKLRTAGGALVALVLATAGLAAARPNETPGAASEPSRHAEAPDKPSGSKTAPPKFTGPDARSEPSRTARTPDKPADPKPASKLTDREALQGWWALEKRELLGTEPKVDEQSKPKAKGNAVSLLIAGDEWWTITRGKNGGVRPSTATLDERKNPKWLDLRTADGSRVSAERAIYTLDGDQLRFCVAAAGSSSRPAEFAATPDVPLAVVTYRREKVPPPAGSGALLGNWSGGGGDRVAALDGHLFFSHYASRTVMWFGGRYTVDATKNPKWIDVELVAPLERVPEVNKLYGCYEVTDGRLRMALGTRRTTRPLDFKADNDTLVFDLAPGSPPKTDVSVPPAARAAPAGVPAGTRPPPDKMEEPLKPKDRADPAALAGHLKAWEKWMAGATNFRAGVTLKRTAWHTGKVETFEGGALCMKPHFAVLRLNNTGDSTKTDYEAYICNETAVYTYNGRAKTVTEFKRPPALSPEATLFGFSFLSGMKASELQERFAVDLFKTDENYIYLDIKPRLAKDRCEFQHLRLALYNPGPLTKELSYLPAEAYLIKPSGDTEHWRFTNPRVNLPDVEPKHFQYVEIKDKGWTVKKAPEPLGAANDGFGEVKRLFAAGRFADAEQLLLAREPLWRGADRVVGHLVLVMCLVELVRKENQYRDERYCRAEKHFRTAVAEADRLPPTDWRAEWVRTQEKSHTDQLLGTQSNFNELLATAAGVAGKYSNTANELVVLSLMYHTQKGKEPPDRAIRIRERMRKLFDELKDKPGVFEGTGEFSRSYWEKNWFSEK